MFAPFKTAMAASVPRFLEEAAQERLILILNHVLASEPVALERLRPHAGRGLRLALQGWPQWVEAFLPAPGAWCVRITPAGLLENESARPRLEAGPDLEVVLDASDPMDLFAKVMSGATPTLQLAGDAQLAADVNWLAENIRWDVAADLERVFGALPADQLQRWGTAVFGGLRQALERVAGFMPRPPRA